MLEGRELIFLLSNFQSIFNVKSKVGLFCFSQWDQGTENRLKLVDNILLLMVIFISTYYLGLCSST